MRKFFNVIFSKIIDEHLVELEKIYEVKFNNALQKEKLNIINEITNWFIDKTRDGEFPKDDSEWWSCIWCSHIDKKDCKYCSNCGAKW